MFNKIFKFISSIFFINHEENTVFFESLDKTKYYNSEFTNFSLDGVFIGSQYNKNIQKDLKKFKYRYNKKSLNKFIDLYKNLFNEYINEDKENIILIGIPIYYLNRIFRTYNHTYLLSKGLSKILDLRFEKILIKNKMTKSQSKLNKKERLGNIKDCFIISGDKKDLIKGKVVIIIDDVISTGITSNEIGKVLKANGAKKVYGLYLASSKTN